MTVPVESKRRGRPPLVDRETVINTAASLGLSTLTMTSLADALGIRHPTLYRYVSGRQEIVQALIDRAFDGASWPTPGDDWRQYVREYAATLRDLYRRNPGMIVESGYMHRKADGLVRALNAFRSALFDYGFSAEDTVLFSEMFIQLVRSSQDYRRTADGMSLTEEQVRELMRNHPDDITRGVDPRIQTALVAFNTNASGTNFDLKVERLIRGFEPNAD